MGPETMQSLLSEVRACTLCEARFRASETTHFPRPIVQIHPKARVLIAGQAPGARVHQSGRPFSDPSGDRLRDWLGLGAEVFYDPTRIAILPMGFCFPGYRNGADLPPPPICAKIWRQRFMDQLPNLRLILPVGGIAQKWHLQGAGNVTQTVAAWRDFLPTALPLPHPSWRNTAWIKRNPWFETELLPVLQSKIKEALHA